MVLTLGIVRAYQERGPEDSTPWRLYFTPACLASPRVACRSRVGGVAGCRESPSHRDRHRPAQHQGMGAHSANESPLAIGIARGLVFEVRASTECGRLCYWLAAGS
jgi:hypothetical protein